MNLCLVFLWQHVVSDNCACACFVGNCVSCISLSGLMFLGALHLEATG